MAGEPYYVTTPIFYVNDAPHIGHAYAMVACDVLARFMRLDGGRVKFLTGTDEHGQKVDKSARAAGLAPQAFCDRVSENFRTTTQLMNISNDDFIRTTEPRHIKASQAIWRAIGAGKSPAGNPNIYLGKYAGWYAVRDEAFYGEDELTTGADGIKRAPSGAEVEWVEEPSYFFRLSEWKGWLLDYYAKHPDFIAPQSRRNEVVSFVSGDLRDLSISRTSFAWGVPVPDDPKHVMYVWLDALTNYITAVGYPDTENAEFKTFWPASLHMVGKDIIRFHCVYWPAFLKAAGLELPKRVFGTGWWTVEGEKMSKSLGNAIAPQTLIDRYGVDALRYFMLRELPFGNDGDFSHRAVVNRMNADLANGIGNLAQRVLSFIHKNAGAKVPSPGPFKDRDQALLSAAAGLADAVRPCFTEQRFHQALELIWDVITSADRYVDAEAPWTLRKTDPARMATVLFTLAETIRHLAILLQPFVPASAGRLLDQLAVPTDKRDIAALRSSRLTPGTPLPAPQGIFPRYVEQAQPA
ncbi:MAG TPA: methionine--tRNA ligase [Stellaceae bacterium]|nr:methionine--tRNA ligase [Stellaceae bacterium]